MEADSRGASNALIRGAHSCRRSAQLHAFVAPGLGIVGVVVFARAVGLGARDCDGVRDVHDFRNDGNGRALFDRSGGRFSVRGVFAGIVHVGVAVERPDARDRGFVWLAADARMDRGASIWPNSFLDFAYCALGLLPRDGCFHYFRATKPGSGDRWQQKPRSCSRRYLFSHGFLNFRKKARRSTALWQPGATLAASLDAEQARSASPPHTQARYTAPSKGEEK